MLKSLLHLSALKEWILCCTKVNMGSECVNDPLTIIFMSCLKLKVKKKDVLRSCYILLISHRIFKH